MIRLDFPTTNNEAEYEALIAELDLAKAAGAGNMIIHCDSQVITSQINGDFECRNERMKKYLEEVKGRTAGLEVKFVQIPREENECADRLAKVASAEFMKAPKQVLFFVQTCLLIDDGKQNTGDRCRRKLDRAFERISTVGLFARREGRCKKIESPGVTICVDQGRLVQKRILSTLPEVSKPQRSRICDEGSSRGDCGNHSGARSLVHKLIRAGYY